MKILSRFTIGAVMVAFPIFASDASILCQDVQAVVLQSGDVEFVTDNCPKAEKCRPREEAQQRFDPQVPGKFVYDGPESMVKIVASSREQGCPLVASLYKIFAHLPVKQISTNVLIGQQTRAENGPYRDEFRDIKALGGDSWEGFVAAAGEKITDCYGKGSAVGSGTPDACCEGLKAISAVDVSTCERLAGGYYCAACGDQVCEAPENRCNCPEDCKKLII